MPQNRYKLYFPTKWGLQRSFSLKMNLINSVSGMLFDRTSMAAL